MFGKQNKKQCYFCAANLNSIDYKNADILKKFITPQAQIIKKVRTGVCSSHQRKLGEAIKRARFLGLIPFIRR